MASKKHHYILWAAGLGVGGFVAYEYLYKPWAAQQAVLATAGLNTTSPLSDFTSVLPSSLLPSPASMVTAPVDLPVVTPTASNLDPGAAVGGVVGACMTIKGGTWTQSQCQTRLDSIVSAYQQAQQAIAQLQGASNPAAAGVPAAQAALEANQAALTIATTNYNNAVAAGNQADAATWKAAADGHAADIANLQASIAAAQAPVNNAAAIAAYQGSMAALNDNYLALTGVNLTGVG
jgi:hypothetical protein